MGRPSIAQVQEQAALDIVARLRGMTIPRGHVDTPEEGTYRKCTFDPFDDEHDAAIKDAIRLYVETWLVPMAQNLHQSLAQHDRRRIDAVDEMAESLGLWT